MKKSDNSMYNKRKFMRITQIATTSLERWHFADSWIWMMERSVAVKTELKLIERSSEFPNQKEGRVQKPWIQKHHQEDTKKIWSRENVAWEEAAQIGRNRFAEMHRLWQTVYSAVYVPRIKHIKRFCAGETHGLIHIKMFYSSWIDV